MNRERLLNVAKALRESPKPKAFYMGSYARSCGTPACAFGHYAARPDLQSAFTLEGGHPIDFAGHEVFHDSGLSAHHFGLERRQLCELFDDGGCGGARTAIQAAEYIETFVARHTVKP
jgi:hypothetical protein